MARCTPGWALALAPIACTCTEPAADASVSVVVPAEHEPRLPAWTGPANPADRLGRTDARLRWRIASGLPTEHSTAAAPSWSALCSEAVACFRSGPWPDAIGWLTQFDPMPVPSDPTDVVATAWPHVAAGALNQLRDELPSAARGTFDAALSGLAEVEFSGGRLDKDGTFLAFVRIPTPWVTLASGALAYAGRAPVRTALADGTEVSWAEFSTGGLVLALDEGVEPAMGWIMFASSAERFTWLATAPRTQAGPAALFARVERPESLLEHMGPSARAWFEPYASAPLLVHIAAQGGFLTARAVSGGKLR